MKRLEALTQRLAAELTLAEAAQCPSFSPGDTPLILDFTQEAQRHLKAAEVALAALANTPEDTELVNTLFRSFHSIKAVSSLLNLNRIQSVAHASESVLDHARRQRVAMPASVSQQLLAATELMREMVETLRSIISPSTSDDDSSSIVRMQDFFQQIGQAARELAAKAGKEIGFAIFGGQTEVDRDLLNGVREPLIHMVRNAIDHGIEPPDVRLQSGKPEVGHIELKAFCQDGSVVIQIADDGRGLCRQRIIEKATEAGIISPGQNMSEHEVFRLIFHPGLSTAEKLTDLSGRGVGMDAVKRSVESMHGRIEIASVEGFGSTFTIRIPKDPHERRTS